MATLIPLEAIHPARRLAALMRLSRRARRRILRALSRRYATWAQRKRELIKSLSATFQNIYREVATWIAREGKPVFAGRAYLADACDCHPDTVTKAVRQLVALGLLVVRARRYQDKRTGRWRQASNVYALPAGPLSEPEQDQLRRFSHAVEQGRVQGRLHRIARSTGHTQIFTKKTQYKVTSGRFSGHKRATASPGGGFASAQTILERWAERGLIPQRP